MPDSSPKKQRNGGYKHMKYMKGLALGVVPGNPLDDITAMERVNFVMKGGEIYKHQ